MKGKSSFYYRALVCSAAIMVLAVAVRAEQPGTAIMTNMAGNARQLKQYTFKQRVETYYQSELKNARTAEVHYSPSGERIVIPLDEQSATQADDRRRGPGARLIAKKIESKQIETKEYVQRLMFLTDRYLSSDPTKLQSAMQAADITRKGSTGQINVAMRNYVKDGDSMTMSFDSASNRPTETVITTSLDDDDVVIVLTFDQIHQGPSYTVKTVVRAEAKQLEVRVFTYEYRL